MKYYVRKETDHRGTFYCAYANPDFTGFIGLDMILEKLHEKFRKIQPADEFIGEFDTDDNGLICGQCGEPTKDGEKCGECKPAEAEHRMEMDR
jgi:hypothetical protein